MTLPDDFKKQMTALVGSAAYDELLSSFATSPPVSIRLNRRKCEGELPFGGLVSDKVGWCSDGFYLSERPFFTSDPCLHSGRYYVQEASSMFLDHVVKHLSADCQMSTVLDMCAAPGGKSTILRANIPESSLLMANEPIPKRAVILNENMTKQGYMNNIITSALPSAYSRSGLSFDFILCDVPCSGEGMFRKDASSISEWSMQSVERCAQLQREIVAEAWKCLKSDGYLVYSTCTFNTRENEENIAWILEHLGGELISIPTDASWGISGSLLTGFDKPVYRFLPYKTRGEGLFMAVIKKSSAATDDLQSSHIGTKTERNKQAKRADRKHKSSRFIADSPLKDDIEYQIIDSGQYLIALNAQWHEHLERAQRSMKVISSGIVIGEKKGKTIIPHHSTAMSINLRSDAFPRVDLGIEDAVRYLRHDAIELPAAAPLGYLLATYDGLPLGFLKNIGTRANNLYPKEWRIRQDLAASTS